MDKRRIIELILTYSERATVGDSKTCTEVFIYTIDPDIDYMEERAANFKKIIKKAFNLFRKSGVYNVEFTLGYGHYFNYDSRLFFRVCQHGFDYDNEVYTLYTYDLNAPATDVDKMSKQAALKRINARIDELTALGLSEAVA